MKKLILLAFILVATLTNAFSQEGNSISGFSKSYACEYRYQYDSAIYVLKPYYSAENYEINLRMGWLSYLAGKNDQSVVYYKKAISLMPAAIEPLLGYVYPLSALEKWEDVIRQYEAILKIDPSNYISNFRLGLIYYNRKDHLVSKKYLDKALNLFPFEYDVVHLSAWNHLNLANYREAKVLFNKALMIRPNDLSSLEGLKNIK
jgi:tetratricopeptide (TPR) repeat protein